MCHPYNVLRKGKIFLSTFVGMRRGEERQTASHWLEEKMRGKVKSKKRLLLKGTVRPFTSAQKRKNKNPKQKLSTQMVDSYSSEAFLLYKY